MNIANVRGKEKLKKARQRDMEFEFSAVQEENENPYFKAFRLARNINDGNHWQACDYMEWIGHKHRLFRAIHKIDYPDNYLPLLEKHKELFVDWLFEIAKQEAIL